MAKSHHQVQLPAGAFATVAVAALLGRRRVTS